jgi:tetratricopeptide (TPR) repeat protein
MADFFTRVGVTAHVAGAHEDVAPRWLRGLPAGELPAAAARVGTVALEQALLDALVEGDRETARRLAEASDEPAIRFQRGILRLLDGRVAEAAACFEAAAEGFPEAWASLAATCLDLGRGDDARRAAERGLAALPDDAITVEAAVRVFARLGDLDRARALLAAAALPMPRRVVLEAVLERPGEGGHRFPGLAARATQRAVALADAGDAAGAEALLRRALTFDASNLEAAGELGWLLGTLGRDAEAVGHYDESIERVPGGELLRFNRGNALLRLGRRDEAIADYARLADLLPEWSDPQVNLVSALCARGDAAAARARLDALRARPGVPPDLVAALEEQVARLKP